MFIFWISNSIITMWLYFCFVFFNKNHIHIFNKYLYTLIYFSNILTTLRPREFENCFKTLIEQWENNIDAQFCYISLSMTNKSLKICHQKICREDEFLSAMYKIKLLFFFIVSIFGSVSCRARFCFTCFYSMLSIFVPRRRDWPS